MHVSTELAQNFCSGTTFGDQWQLGRSMDMVLEVLMGGSPLQTHGTEAFFDLRSACEDAEGQICPGSLGQGAAVDKLLWAFIKHAF